MVTPNPGSFEQVVWPNPIRGISIDAAVFKLVRTSPTSFAEATKAAIAEAAKTVHHMNWFGVVRESGRIADEKVKEFQVTLKIGFKIER